MKSMSFLTNTPIRIALLICLSLSVVKGFHLLHTASNSKISHKNKKHDMSMNSNTHSKSYCLNVTLYINPLKRIEFLQCIKQNQENTLKNESKARIYTWGESTSQENVFHFQEQYDDKDGFVAHTKTSHFAVWEKFASQSDAFIKPPEIQFFEEM